MGSTSEIMWDRLCLELKTTGERADASLMPVLAAINSIIDVQSDYQNILRTLNFLSFELIQNTENLNEEDRLIALNDYFFKHLKFQGLSFEANAIKDHSPNSNHFLLGPCLTQKQGNPLLLRLIYAYLAHQIQLPISVIHTPQNNLLKWIRKKRTEIIDLNLSGQSLTSKELASICNLEFQSEGFNKSSYLEPMTFSDQIVQYCEQLLKCYDNDYSDREKIILWSSILELQPNNIQYLGQRALLYSKRGELVHAKFDLKRYFSFVQLNKAPLPLKRAYFELCEDPHHQFIQKTQTTEITTKNLLH